MTKPNGKPGSNIELWSQVPFDHHGVPITRVVDQEEAEKAHLVVCVKAGEEQECFKADNIYTNCADCGTPITHRPHAPKTPPKVCVECAIKRAEAEEDDE